MNEKKIYELHADVCKTMGHPLRIEVIYLLQENELCFSDILEATGGLKSNLSQHLSIMTKKGILIMRREGKYNYYSLASKKVSQACQLMREVLIDTLEKQMKILENIGSLIK
jgi:DNA-binding transcriptional ArsR family regulator